MKRIAIGIAILAAAIGCKPKPTVLEGTIVGYDGQEVEARISGDLRRDSVAVAEDGTFHIEKVMDEAFAGRIKAEKGGSCCFVLIPGKHYHFNLDLTKTPAEWSFDTDCPAEQDFYRYMYDSLLKMDFAKYECLDRFVDYDAMWAERLNEAEKRLGTVKNRSALKYFRQTIAFEVTRFKVDFADQLMKKGVSPSDDPDYVAFFNSVDLSDEKTELSLLDDMLDIKSAMYCDTIPAAVRYIRAIDDLVPAQQEKDSLVCKYIESVIKDGRISSEYEGNFLLETAERLVSDNEVLDDYRARVDKAMSLLPGKDAIDFAMTDPAGKTVHLSDFKGKVVYVDFWATWCGPCCKQIPYMKEVAAKYALNPDVACISVSLDSITEWWKKKLDSDKPEWLQYIAENGGKAIATNYGFRAIPRFMVFDKDGRIVSVNAPRPENMDAVCAIIDSLI